MKTEHESISSPAPDSTVLLQDAAAEALSLDDREAYHREIVSLNLEIATLGQRDAEREETLLHLSQQIEQLGLSAAAYRQTIKDVRHDVEKAQVERGNALEEAAYHREMHTTVQRRLERALGYIDAQRDQASSYVDRDGVPQMGGEVGPNIEGIVPGPLKSRARRDTEGHFDVMSTAVGPYPRPRY